MHDKPYYSLMDQICRSNGWVLGADQGNMVLGVPQQDGSQQSVVINDFADAGGVHAIRLWSPVCPTSKFPAEQAMQANMQLPHGALAHKDGQVVVTATRVLNQTNQADMTHLITTVAYYGCFYAAHYGKQ